MDPLGKFQPSVTTNLQGTQKSDGPFAGTDVQLDKKAGGPSANSDGLSIAPPKTSVKERAVLQGPTPEEMKEMDAGQLESVALNPKLDRDTRSLALVELINRAHDSKGNDLMQELNQLQKIATHPDVLPEHKNLVMGTLLHLGQASDNAKFQTSVATKIGALGKVSAGPAAGGVASANKAISALGLLAHNAVNPSVIKAIKSAMIGVELSIRQSTATQAAKKDFSTKARVVSKNVDHLGRSFKAYQEARKSIQEQEAYAQKQEAKNAQRRHELIRETIGSFHEHARVRANDRKKTTF